MVVRMLRGYLEKSIRRRVVAFFLLNAAVIAAVLTKFGTRVFLYGVPIYLFATLFIALSPVGEWIVRLLSGATKMSSAEWERIRPLFERVRDKAREISPAIPEEMEFRIIRSRKPNAAALGKNCICVTERMLGFPDDEILGVLAHETGHLANRHAQLHLLIGGGNFLIGSAIMMAGCLSVVVAVVCNVLEITGYSLAAHMRELCYLAVIIYWTKYRLVILRWVSREYEFEADAYTVGLGYGEGLAKMLDSIPGTDDMAERSRLLALKNLAGRS